MAFALVQTIVSLVGSIEDIKKMFAQIHYCSEAKREYIIVFSSEEEFNRAWSSGFDVSESRKWLVGESKKAEFVRKQLVSMISRKFKIDELVAESYLAVADWDPIKAIEQYRNIISKIDAV